MQCKGFVPVLDVFLDVAGVVIYYLFAKLTGCFPSTSVYRSVLKFKLLIYLWYEVKYRTCC